MMNDTQILDWLLEREHVEFNTRGEILSAVSQEKEIPYGIEVDLFALPTVFISYHRKKMHFEVPAPAHLWDTSALRWAITEWKRQTWNTDMSHEVVAKLSDKRYIIILKP